MVHGTAIQCLLCSIRIYLNIIIIVICINHEYPLGDGKTQKITVGYIRCYSNYNRITWKTRSLTVIIVSWRIARNCIISFVSRGSPGSQRYISTGFISTFCVHIGIGAVNYHNASFPCAKHASTP